MRNLTLETLAADIWHQVKKWTLKLRALKIEQNTEYSVRDSDGAIGPWVMSFHPMIEHMYSVRNGMCVFMEEGLMYLVPATDKTILTLRQNGFRPRVGYVPFADGSAPLWSVRKWNKWQKAA